MNEIQELIENVSKENPDFTKQELRNRVIDIIKSKRFLNEEQLNAAIEEVDERLRFYE
jgi:hypothetical protein